MSTATVEPNRLTGTQRRKRWARLNELIDVPNGVTHQGKLLTLRGFGCGNQLAYVTPAPSPHKCVRASELEPCQ